MSQFSNFVMLKEDFILIYKYLYNLIASRSPTFFHEGGSGGWWWGGWGSGRGIQDLLLRYFLRERTFLSLNRVTTQFFQKLEYILQYI